MMVFTLLFSGFAGGFILTKHSVLRDLPEKSETLLTPANSKYMYGVVDQIDESSGSKVYRVRGFDTEDRMILSIDLTEDDVLTSQTVHTGDYLLMMYGTPGYPDQSDHDVIEHLILKIPPSYTQKAVFRIPAKFALYDSLLKSADWLSQDDFWIITPPEDDSIIEYEQIQNSNPAFQQIDPEIPSSD